jgi:peptidoglycan hydrolase-like protein with peptidoglycan-binding domain
MIKAHNVFTLLALCSAGAVPACSTYGGSNSNQTSHASYASPQPPALSQATIQQIQARLQQAGTYNGAIDGVWGPATEGGVRRFQQQHNLSPTGQLDGDTLAALKLGGANQSFGSAQPIPSTPPEASRYGDNNMPSGNASTSSNVAAQPAASIAR